MIKRQTGQSRHREKKALKEEDRCRDSSANDKHKIDVPGHDLNLKERDIVDFESGPTCYL